LKMKKEQMIQVLKIMFGVMLVSVVLLFFFGELFMPYENPTENGRCELYDAVWERVLSDGTRESVTIPGNCDVLDGERVRLETTLSKDLKDTWFCMRASQQDMYVYIGGELRKEYTTKGTRLFGKDSASAFVFFDVHAEDAGKILAIELVSNSEYAGFFNAVYVGDKYDIISLFVKECYVVIMVSFYMLILGSITFLIGCVIRVVYKIKADITYLGLGILLISMAMIVESRLRQFFMPNSSIASHVGFLLTMLIPYPFIVYASRIQKGRYEKLYHPISLLVAFNFLISTLLQIFHIVDFVDSMVVSYGLIIVTVIVITITIIIDIKDGRLREYGEIIYGFIAMIAVTIWETYLTFVPEANIMGGVALSFGLIILLFMAGLKTAREMLAIEREKQMAIVASEAKANFLANMSHEIRTPINTIIGMNEMILRENQDEKLDEYAKSVHNAGKLLLGLINDILDFSKIEAGKMDIVEVDYHLSKMLTDVINGIRIKAEQKKLLMKVEVEESLPSVLHGDEIRIRQILNNLLSNAVKYTKKGAVTLHVSSKRSGEEFILSISVTDTGMGIRTEDLDKLFSSFQRLEENKNRYIEGTGLGLSITRQLVEMMDGTIEVKSKHGKGSCFTVKIPQRIIDDTAIGNLEDAYQRDNTDSETAQTKLYAPTAQILVVDDNEMNLAVAEALLKRTGVRLTKARGGNECLTLCRQTKYDLVLMDHMMPKPDGIETLHILRADKKSLNCDTKVIVLTANAISGMAEMYIGEGFSDYLTKPIVAADLEKMIYKHLPKNKVNVEDISYIDKQVGLAYCGNEEEIYREMLKTYYAQGKEYREKLSAYYIARDWENYRIIVHALKSTSLMIGATAFSERAKYLEMAAKEGKEEILLTESEEFLVQYDMLLEKGNE